MKPTVNTMSEAEAKKAIGYRKYKMGDTTACIYCKYFIVGKYKCNYYTVDQKIPALTVEAYCTCDNARCWREK